MIRLIALDLDGTLLNSALKVSERNGEAVRRALESGVKVVLATTRWYLLAKRTADRLGIDTPLVCNNGAIVKRPGDGSELLHLRLDQELAREVTALADERDWETFTTIEDATYMRPRPGIIAEKLPAGLRLSERQADEVARGQPTSVLVYSEEAVDEIAGRFLEAYDGRANFSLNRPRNYPHYVVLTHQGADKGSALEMVCHELDVPMTEVLAMGDSESDLGMIQQAGLGIAMNNAPDEVKRAALHIAPGNDADGVAWAIERFAL
ncbi:MAG: Cof-type HAD-IIB family hydrolase [Dehalococcoidia bacterium]|nr:Cof-type HAD-IIB family hydrolase [Dehalococcoidia bacterium]